MAFNILHSPTFSNKQSVANGIPIVFQSYQIVEIPPFLTREPLISLYVTGCGRYAESLAD
nr:MAG TPA: hypothetical protein [Caudoviricetes sp.]